MSQTRTRPIRPDEVLEMRLAHALSGDEGDLPPSGWENGIPYIALCVECGSRVVYSLGAWDCITHRDRGHVRFVPCEPFTAEQ